MAAKLLRGLASHSGQLRTSRELEESALLFEQLAHQLLSTCEEVDGAKAALLVRRAVDARAVQHAGGRAADDADAPVGDARTQAGDVVHEGRSALPLAHESGCLALLAHSVSLKIVHQTWCAASSRQSATSSVQVVGD